MAVDPEIALKTQVANPTNFISGFLDLGMKRNALARGDATLAADIARSNAESDVAVQSAPSRISAAKSAAGQAEAKMSQAQLENMRAHTANMTQQLQGLIDDPQLNRAKVTQSIIDSALTQNAPSSAIAQALKDLPNNDDPAALKKFVMQGLIRTQQLSQHLQTIAPAPIFINNGQQAVPVAAGNPALTGVQPGIQQGVPVQMQIPPNAPTFNPATNQPELYGARPPGAAPVATGPALGVSEGVQGQVKPNVDHFNAVIQEATAAPTRIGLLNNIKELAPIAITGDQPTVKKLVSKIAGYLGIDSATIAQTNTDVLAKETALLASKGGNTDMARLLNEAATPGAHMTKDAILKTADQLIGQERLKIAAQQYFTGTPPNSPEYAKKLTAWNKVADPRAFEYAAKTPEERKAMIKGMSPQDLARLKGSMQALHMMGVEPE